MLDTEMYGDFLGSMIRLDDELREVRAVWNDQTALTYDHINENMKMISAKIWEHYCNSLNGYESVKQNLHRFF